MKRIITIIVSCCVLVFALAACTAKTNKSITVTVIDEISVAESSDNKIEISGTVEVPENVNAGECIRQLCNQNDIVVEGVDEGYITAVGDVSNADDYAWMFYINGELAEIGIDDYIPSDGDTITLSYVNWSELFAE